MGKVSQQMVKQAGLDLNVLRHKLIAAAGAEVTTFYYYTLRRANAIGRDRTGGEGAGRPAGRHSLDPE
jgi:ferritin-like protein